MARTDFLGFLQRFVLNRSLTPSFELFQFLLRIPGDIHNRKTTPRLGESGSGRLSDLAIRGVDDSRACRVREWFFECLNENSASRRFGNSPTRRVGESLSRVRESLSRVRESLSRVRESLFEYCKKIFFFFVYFFGGLECVGHSFAYVAHF
jgi:hypothetical protein